MQANDSSRWLQRLALVKEEFRTTRWPKTAEEGMRQVLELSARGWKQLIADLAREHPGASIEDVQRVAYELVTEWADARRKLARDEASRRVSSGQSSR